VAAGGQGEAGRPLPARAVQNGDHVALAQAQDRDELASLDWAERHLPVPYRLRGDEEPSVMRVSHRVSRLTRIGF